MPQEAVGTVAVCSAGLVHNPGDAAFPLLFRVSVRLACSGCGVKGGVGYAAKKEVEEVVTDVIQQAARDAAGFEHEGAC